MGEPYCPGYGAVDYFTGITIGYVLPLPAAVVLVCAIELAAAYQADVDPVKDKEE